MGPVINETAVKTILNYIEIGKGEGRLVSGGNAVETTEGGYYIQPTVIADVSPDARIAQEEIFGPVLAVIQREGLPASARGGQQHGVRAHRLGLFRRPPQARAR